MAAAAAATAAAAAAAAAAVLEATPQPKPRKAKKPRVPATAAPPLLAGTVVASFFSPSHSPSPLPLPRGNWKEQDFDFLGQIAIFPFL